MRYDRPATINCQAVELSRPVAGAHKQNEERNYTTVWVKKGVEFKHWNPENCEIQLI